MPESASKPPHITRHTLKLLFGTLASRVLGFVRMKVMAHYFGGRSAVDNFNIAFMVPNMLRGVLGEQAIESAFLPTFKSLAAQGKVREAWRTASVLLNWLTLLLVTFAALSVVFAPQLVAHVLAPGFSAFKADETACQGQIMAPFMVLIGLVAFYGSLLLAHGRFWMYGLAPTLFNVGSIAAMALLYKRLGVYSIAAGVLVGGVLELAASVIPLALGRRRGTIEGRCRISDGLRDPNLWHVLVLAGPVCLGALATRCEVIVDRAIASYLDEGSIAALGYGMQLVQLPFALFALSVGRAALVPLSEQAGRGDIASFERTTATAIRLGLFFLIPLSVATPLLAWPLAGLLRGGEFQDYETDMAAIALVYYGVGLASMGLTSILSRALYALKDTMSPVRAAIMALAVNALLSAVLALTPLRHGGIALATSIAMSLEVVLVCLWLRRRLVEAGGKADFRWLWKPVARICLATVAMSGVLIILRPAVAVWIPADAVLVHIPLSPLIARCAGLGILCAAGGIAYGAVIFLLDREAVLRVLRRGGVQAEPPR